MKISAYNIHSFLQLEVNHGQRLELVKDLDRPLSYFEVPHCERPDIVFNIGAFEPTNQDSRVVDHKWFIKPDYIYVRERGGRLSYEIEINGLEAAQTVVNVNVKPSTLKARLMPALLAQNIFLRPILDFKLAQAGVLSVHGAGVAFNNGAVLFMGRGGCFKTTLMMDLVRRHGAKFLGDDRVLIKDGIVYSFPMHQRLFAYKTSKLSTENATRTDKLKYLMSSRYDVCATDFVVPRKNLALACCLIKADVSGMSLRKLGRGEMAEKCALSQRMESIVSLQILGVSAGKFHETLASYAYVFPDSGPARFWQHYADLAGANLPFEDNLEISIPKHYSPVLLERIVEYLRGNGIEI